LEATPGYFEGFNRSGAASRREVPSSSDFPLRTFRSAAYKSPLELTARELTSAVAGLSVQRDDSASLRSSLRKTLEAGTAGGVFLRGLIADQTRGIAPRSEAVQRIWPERGRTPTFSTSDCAFPSPTRSPL